MDNNIKKTICDAMSFLASKPATTTTEYKRAKAIKATLSKQLFGIDYDLYSQFNCIADKKLLAMSEKFRPQTFDDIIEMEGKTFRIKSIERGVMHLEEV